MVIDCPSCSRKLRVPEDLLGKLVRCPTCGHTFAASATPSSAEPAEASVTADLPPVLELNESESDSQQLTDVSLQSAADFSARAEGQDHFEPCPSCGERIARDAVRCQHCGEVLDEEEDGERPWEEQRGRIRGRRDAEPHRGVFILVLGILSIVMIAICAPVGLPFGIAAWIMGQGDLRKIRSNLMDPEGEGLTQAGWVCGIIGTILSSLCSVGWLLYFAFAFTMVGAMKNMRPPGGPVPVPGPPVPPPKKVQADFVPQQLRDYLPGRPC